MDALLNKFARPSQNNAALALGIPVDAHQYMKAFEEKQLNSTGTGTDRSEKWS